MSKLNEIKNQLAQRLEKGSSRLPQPVTEAPTEPYETVSKPIQKTAAIAPVRSDKGISGVAHTTKTDGIVKLSVSLYSFDIDCLDKIREFMRKNGVRNLTDSEALRLACRAVKIDDAFVGIYKEMLKEDKRRRKD